MENPEYASVEYWNNRYQEDKQGDGNDDHADAWYYTYDELKQFLKAPSKTSSALEVGCGRYPLCPDLRRQGGWAGRIVGIDFSAVCIEELKAQAITSDLFIEYIEADARNLHTIGNEFDLVVDKGCIDAMLSDGISYAAELIHSYAQAVSVGGRCVIISHIYMVQGDEKFDAWIEGALFPALNKIQSSNVRWKLRFCSAGEDNPSIFVMTKLRSSPRSAGLIEIEYEDYS